MHWTVLFLIGSLLFICIPGATVKPSDTDNNDTPVSVDSGGAFVTQKFNIRKQGSVFQHEKVNNSANRTFFEDPKQDEINDTASVLTFQSEINTGQQEDVDMAQGKAFLRMQDGESAQEKHLKRTSTTPMADAATKNEFLVAVKNKQVASGISNSENTSGGKSQVISQQPFQSLDPLRKNTNQNAFKKSETLNYDRKGSNNLDGNIDLVEDGSESCCRVSLQKGRRIADCRCCNLTFVPKKLPNDTDHLLLGYNKLDSSSLYSGVFAIYPHLRALQFDSNNITSLPVGVFEGLTELEDLDVYNNSIIMDDNFPGPEVFSPLNATLVYLKMNKNNKNVTLPGLKYPDKSLSVLTNLQYLYIDGLTGKDFGPGFGEIKNLTNLTVSGFQEGNCVMNSIAHTTFSHLSHLQYLNISDCGLNGSHVDRNAFSNLTSLEVLDVSNNFDLGIEAVGNFMHSLKDKKNFRHLKMQRIGTRFAPCIVIYNHTLRHFKESRLEIIEAMDNEIEMIEIGALKMLPPTLRSVNLTNNKITFGAYWRDLGSLKGLIDLHLDGYSNPENFPEFYPPKNLHCGGRPSQQASIGEHDLNKDTCLCPDEDCDDGSQADIKFILPLPPNLKNVTMHSNSLSYTLTNISFCSSNKLESVDISGNMFHKLIGPVSGLTHLKYLNMSSCFIEEIYYQFFDNMTTLEHLNLYQNLLGDSLHNDEEGDTFDTLPNLKYLNISFNNLFKLNSKVFKNLNKLEILDMSINRLSVANFTIKHMSQLRFLDLHKNQIGTLDSHTRDHISKLLQNKINITVDMRQNPISCTCMNLPFLEWVIETNVFGNNYTLYYCKFESVNDNAVEMRDGYQKEVENLRRICASNVSLFLGVIGGTLLVVIFIVGLLIYRFRWTLRYWFHAAKLKIYSSLPSNSEEFEYDVFISYAQQDEDFVLQEIYPNLTTKRNLRLMIHGEKFQAGRHITENIYMAVTQCRKTLVLVTRSMLASHWCTYELQMARMEAISRGRNVLVFLFKEEIPSSEVSVDVLAYIKTSTCITYPSDLESEHRETFWNRLADDLRDR